MIQGKDCTIISTAGSLRGAHRTRAMIFSMRQVEALRHRSSPFEIVSDGGLGVGGNGGRSSWRRVIGSNKTFSISKKNNHRCKMKILVRERTTHKKLLGDITAQRYFRGAAPLDYPH